jgi:tetratricopeptide (TPR) repeat protein
MMKRIVAIALLSLALLALLAGCTPKELRTVKIEMGTISKPRPNPDLPRVQKNLDVAVKLYPNNAEVYQYVGRLASLEKRYSDMAAAFDKADQLNPKLKPQNDQIRQLAWKDLFDLGKRQAGEQKLDSALVSFKNSAVCWPERYESLINASVVAAQLGNFNEAYQLSSQAYAAAPDTLIVIETHAKMCVADSQYAEAKTMFEKVLAKNPTNPDILLAVANLSRSLNDTTSAINYLRRALEINKTDTAAWFDLGILYFHVKQYCNAQESFQRVVQLAPSDKDAQINYTLAMMSCADTTAKADPATANAMYATCRAELEKFTAANPDNCDGWRYLATAYIRLKLEKEANIAFKKFTECDKAK